MSRSQRYTATTPCLILALMLTACAANQPRENHDPLEKINRVTYRFNDVVDRAVLRPVAKGYTAVTPQFFRTGMTNFFNNLTSPVVIVNDLFQGKFKAAGIDTARLVINTVAGFGGLFDIAAIEGLEASDEDFGQTLGTWGIPNGPYLVLPIIGPSNFRDGFGIAVDLFLNPMVRDRERSRRDKVLGLYTIHTRSRLLSTDQTIENALDPYIFVREAYLQRREFLLYDGDPPDEFDLEDELDDEEFDE